MWWSVARFPNALEPLTSGRKVGKLSNSPGKIMGAYFLIFIFVSSNLTQDEEARLSFDDQQNRVHVQRSKLSVCKPYKHH